MSRGPDKAWDRSRSAAMRTAAIVTAWWRSGNESSSSAESDRYATLSSPRRGVVATRRGFSLVELTIVIGVIIILVALVLAVSTIVIAKNEERSTRTLTLLDTRG